MAKRRLIFNRTLIDSGKFEDSLINVDDAIPILLMNEFSEEVYQKRIDLYAERPELEELDNFEIVQTEMILKSQGKNEAEEFQLQYVLDFLERHEELAPMLKRVEKIRPTDLKILLANIMEAFFGELDYF